MMLPPVPHCQSPKNEPTCAQVNPWNHNPDLPKKGTPGQDSDSVVLTHSTSLPTALPVYGSIPIRDEEPKVYQSLIPPFSSEVEEDVEYSYAASHYLHPPLSEPQEIYKTTEGYEKPVSTTQPLYTVLCASNIHPLPSPPHQHPLCLPPPPDPLPPLSVSPSSTTIHSPLPPLPSLEINFDSPPKPRPRLRSLVKAASALQSAPVPPLSPTVYQSSSPRVAPPSDPPLSYQPDVVDVGLSDSDDPYLAFPMDIELLDISKLTLEQLDQIDPRQAQLWMLLKMHQMVRKVEDVYVSAEQLYSTHQAPPPLPKKPSKQESREDNRESQSKKYYENTGPGTLKRPVPTPRKNVAKSQSSQENQEIPKECFVTDAPESKYQEAELMQDTPRKVVKLYRKQKVIGKLL